MKREEVIALADRYELPTYRRIDLVAERGEGSWIFDVDGRRFLDLYGGHAVTLLGHSPPQLVDAIAEQAKKLQFYSNLVYCEARARAAERLVRLSPYDDGRAFFCNSGAEANETALKIARNATGRKRVVVFEGSFHGRTLGALAASTVAPRKAQADPVIPPGDAYVFAPHGNVPDALDESVAAVLVEPIQSMGGMQVMTQEFGEALRRRCDEVGALLIFDEVQTAPARTGAWFYGDSWGLVPDIISTAKGIAGGFPAGVVLVSGSVADSVFFGDQGTTFGGGPLAATAIDTTLAMLEEIDAPARARAIEAMVREGLAGREVLGRGALLGVYVPDKTVVPSLREHHGVLVGGCPGNPSILRLMPPLTITDDELETGLSALREVLA
ncbi:MAG: aspartate aminotransferase family protein [Planctomycetota bacterium]